MALGLTRIYTPAEESADELIVRLQALTTDLCRQREKQRGAKTIRKAIARVIRLMHGRMSGKWISLEQAQKLVLGGD